MPCCFALPQQRFSYLDVEWGSNLDVLTITLYHRNLTAETCEYRQAYPEKAVIYSGASAPENGKAVMDAGGSCPNVK